MSRGTRSGRGDVKVLEGVLEEGLSSPSDAVDSGGETVWGTWEEKGRGSLGCSRSDMLPLYRCALQICLVTLLSRGETQA